MWWKNAEIWVEKYPQKSWYKKFPQKRDLKFDTFSPLNVYFTKNLDKNTTRGKAGATMKARKAAEARQKRSKWRLFLCCGK